MNVETKARVTLFLIFGFLLEPQGPVMGKKKLEGSSMLDYRPPDAGLRMQLLWGASNFRGTFKKSILHCIDLALPTAAIKYPLNMFCALASGGRSSPAGTCLSSPLERPRGGNHVR